MSRFAIRPIVASLAVALAAGTFAGAASAAPDAAPAATQSGADHASKDAGGHHFHHMHEMRDAIWLPGVGPIAKKEIAALKLDANQQSLFSAAQQTQEGVHKAMRENQMNRRKMLDEQLKAGKLDPHALADAQGQARQQMQAQADQARQKWLALWDSLNDGQRQQVTQFVKDRQARKQAHMQEHRKEGHSGAGHRPAPAAPATSG
ncbi:hypothetical protein AKI39_14460 [Bordetella sp. H567]|uniref:hypothetical protein n=1 Tax=Bordetella sp. H567 TaxID=1697043 RepID=UPI00081D0FC4|nr:hypothetical protein [Bordetella sp. H567]AOB31632.1 hypothetical protein AKI39_14460 [Bordetella sp. H567]